MWQNDSERRFVDDISDEKDQTAKQASCLKNVSFMMFKIPIFTDPF